MYVQQFLVLEAIHPQTITAFSGAIEDFCVNVLSSGCGLIVFNMMIILNMLTQVIFALETIIAPVSESDVRL
jgi:hypothetical protein